MLMNNKVTLIASAGVVSCCCIVLVQPGLGCQLSVSVPLMLYEVGYKQDFQKWRRQSEFIYASSATRQTL
jgi:hypothetical protein